MKENAEKYPRSISIMHNASEGTEEALNTVLQKRVGKETIHILDVRDYDWSGPMYHRLPFLVSPEGIYEKTEGLIRYANLDDDSRRI